MLFNVDLDNTLIYSYKHDIGVDKRCVEVYQGREVSFITGRTYELLGRLSHYVMIVPTTTRTIEQYQRINIGSINPDYALVCNGGVLLVNGKEDDEWYNESMDIVKPCQYELKKATGILKEDMNRCFELRNIKNLFIFTKSSSPYESMQRLRAELDMSLVDVLCNGVKVYVVPKVLNKGNGVKRLKEKLKAYKVISSGDSEFDIPMLNYADIGVAPLGLGNAHELNDSVKMIDSKNVFSEEMLEYVGGLILKR